jgi:hypothetical protein
VSIHGDVSDELGRRTAARARPVFQVSAPGDVDSLRFIVCGRLDCRQVFFLCGLCDRGYVEIDIMRSWKRMPVGDDRDKST